MFSLPVWSRHHPVIPMRYVPEWTTDMKNRRLLVKVRITVSISFLRFLENFIIKFCLSGNFKLILPKHEIVFHRNK